MQEPCNDSGSIFANTALGHLSVILILILPENYNQRERNAPRSLKTTTYCPFEGSEDARHSYNNSCNSQLILFNSNIILSKTNNFIIRVKDFKKVLKIFLTINVYFQI